MKQMLAVFMVLLSMLVNGCQSDSPKKSQKIFSSTASEIMFNKVLSALDAKDSDALKNLFAPNTLTKVPQIDNQIADLMNFYKGKSTAKPVFGAGGEGEIRDGDWVYLVKAPLPEELMTDQAVYSVQFNSVAANDRDTNDVGLWWLRLTNESGEECSAGDRYEGRKPKLPTGEED